MANEFPPKGSDAEKPVVPVEVVELLVDPVREEEAGGTAEVVRRAEEPIKAAPCVADEWPAVVEEDATLLEGAGSGA